MKTIYMKKGDHTVFCDKDSDAEKAFADAGYEAADAPAPAPVEDPAKDDKTESGMSEDELRAAIEAKIGKAPRKTASVEDLRSQWESLNA